MTDLGVPHSPQPFFNAAATNIRVKISIEPQASISTNCMRAILLLRAGDKAIRVSPDFSRAISYHESNIDATEFTKASESALSIGNSTFVNRDVRLRPRAAMQGCCSDNKTFVPGLTMSILPIGYSTFASQGLRWKASEAL